MRFAQTYDRRAAGLRRAACRDPRRRRPGRLRDRLPVGGPAQPRDGQDDVAGGAPPRPRALRGLLLFDCRASRDDWTERFAASPTAFRDVSGLVDARGGARIAADDLDLLVDLSTHTKGARPGILALKPARVQITHVASAGTRRPVDGRLQADRPLCRTCRRARSIRSSRCSRWPAASIRTGASRRPTAPFDREGARASPRTRS